VPLGPSLWVSGDAVVTAWRREANQSMPVAIFVSFVPCETRGRQCHRQLGAQTDCSAVRGARGADSEAGSLGEWLSDAYRAPPGEDSALQGCSRADRGRAGSQEGEQQQPPHLPPRQLARTHSATVTFVDARGDCP